MALPTLPAGHIPTAAEWAMILDAINTPRLVAYKTANETVNNSATLQNDNELFLTVAANKKYIGHLHLHYSAHATAQFKVDFTGPAGSTMPICTFQALVTGPAVAYNDCVYGACAGMLGEGVGAHTPYEERFSLVVGATGGTLQLRWAQTTAHASDCVVYAGSSLVLIQTSW